MKLKLFILLLFVVPFVAKSQNNSGDFTTLNVVRNLGIPVQDTIQHAYKLGEVRTRPQDSLAYRWSGHAWQVILTGVAGITIPTLNTVLSAGNSSSIGINVGTSTFGGISVPSIATAGQVLMVVVNPNGTFSAQTIPGGTTLINSLNGLTASAQFLKVSFTVATSPAWSDVIATHTLNFPMASTADTGLVTPTEVVAWNGKYTLPGGGTSAQYVNGTGALEAFPSLLADSGQFTTSGGGIAITGVWPNLNFSVSSSGGIAALTGAITTPGGGSGVTTISTNVVTNTNLAQMAQLTIKGNNTTGTANAIDLTVAQFKTMIPETDTVWRVVGTDSIYFKIDGRQHSILDSGGITSNLPITVTLAGDVTGSQTGTSSISIATTVAQLLGKALPSLPTPSSLLRYTGSAFVWDNTQFVSTAVLSDSLSVADTITIVNEGTVGWPNIYGSSTKNIYARLIVNSQLNTDQSQVIQSAANTFTKTSHGFVIGEPISMSGGAFVGADTVNPAIGVVSRVIDANNFELTYTGYVSWTSGLTVGDYYYPSEPAGTVTSTAPTKSQPVFYVINSTTILVNIMRPVNYAVIPGGSGGTGVTPTLDAVLGQGNVSSNAATVGSFTASGTVIFSNLTDAVSPLNTEILVSDTTAGGLTYHVPGTFINMSVNRNGYVATWDSVHNDFYLAQGGSGGGSSLIMGPIDGQSANTQGATITGGELYLQSAGTNAGLLTVTGSQTLGGVKIWTGQAQFTNSLVQMTAVTDISGIAPYQVAMFDTTNSNTIHKAPAEFIDMTLAQNGYTVYWNGTDFYMGPPGSITGVTVSNLAPLFTTSNSAGPNITATMSQTPSGPWTIYGNNTSSSAVQTFFVPVLASGLFASQGTVTTVLHGSASGSPTWAQVNMSTDVTNVLNPANGGTGNGSYVVGDMLYASGTSAFSILTPNTTTTREFLIGTGTGTAGAAPTWGLLTASDIVTGLTFTPENVINKSTSTSLGSSNVLYPTQNAVLTYVTSNAFPKGGGILGTTLGYVGYPVLSSAPTGIAATELVYTITNNAIYFTGANGFSSEFIFGASANRSYTLPDISDVITTNTAIQTLSNKNLSSPNFTYGSDAAGDLMVRGASTYARLPVGSVGQQLTVVSTNTLGYTSPAPTLVNSLFVTSQTSTPGSGLGSISANGTYRASGYLNVNAIDGGVVLQVEVIYTDQGGASVTLPMVSSGGVTNISSNGRYYFPAIIFRAKASTAIAIQAIQTAGTVDDFNIDFGETLEFMNL
jgi:hypothetical protein